MALPLALPLLFTGLSIGANTIGANKSRKAMDAVHAAETLRQRRLDDHAFAINDKARERFDDTKGQQAERAEGLTELYNDAAASEPVREMPAAPQTDSNLVVASDAKASAKAEERIAENADNLAAFRSFADLFGDFGRAGQRDAGELNTIGSFKRGSQSVLPLELQAASEKGAGWRLAGDLFGAAGAFMTPMALTAGGGTGLAGLFGSKPLTATSALSGGAPAAAGTVVPAPNFSGPMLPALY